MRAEGLSAAEGNAVMDLGEQEDMMNSKETLRGPDDDETCTKPCQVTGKRTTSEALI